MIFLKFFIIILILVAIAAHAVHNYIKAIDDVVAVQKSNTCVILVIDGAIQFVTTEENAHNELAEYSNIAANTNLHVRETFESQATMDVVEKLSKIGNTRSTFLVYFTAGLSQAIVPEVTGSHPSSENTENKHHHHDHQHDHDHHHDHQHAHHDDHDHQHDHHDDHDHQHDHHDDHHHHDRHHGDGGLFGIAAKAIHHG